jgi:hypothetical protein
MSSMIVLQSHVLSMTRMFSHLFPLQVTLDLSNNELMDKSFSLYARSCFLLLLTSCLAFFADSAKH